MYTYIYNIYIYTAGEHEPTCSGGVEKSNPPNMKHSQKPWFSSGFAFGTIPWAQHEQGLSY